MPKRTSRLMLLAAPVLLCLTASLVYYLPPVHSRLAWRVEGLVLRIRHTINPPEQQVFTPQQQSDEILVQTLVSGTIQAVILSATPTPELAIDATPTPTQPGPTDTPTPTPTFTPSPTAIPVKVELPGVRFEYQQMNNCGPTTLAMALSYWGWEGNQVDTRSYLRPLADAVDDKNVSPIEMVNYVEGQTGLKAVARVGGELGTLKRFLAAGFPVMIEKGLQHAPTDWMGHYVLVTGYDDERGRFTTQDAYVMENFPVPYTDFTPQWWRDFNNVYIVIYPPEREAEVTALLGPDADPAYNYQAAAERSLVEIPNLSGRDLFFAWYNLGSNRTALGDWLGAAQAYDQAFAVYPSISENDRPWRMLWYQTGPYEAYYNAGRYQDVIDLSTNTLVVLSKPILEESLYWRGMAKAAMGDLDGARKDLLRAVELNPYYAPPRDALLNLAQ